MSKELTEKWKNNTLEKGWYYVSCYNDWKGSVFKIIAWACDGTIALPLKEVLAPVPSYEQHLEANQIIYSLKDARSKAVDEYIERWLK